MTAHVKKRNPPRHQCSVPGCERLAPCKKLCVMHYYRWRRCGDTEACFNNRYLSHEQRFWLKVDQSKNCWEWTGCIDRRGYGQIRWFGKVMYAHRISYLLRHGTMPINLILHSCDNPKCVNPDHLREGDHKDNTADMIERGRGQKGSQAYNSKLTETQVVRVLQKMEQGIPSAQIAKLYGVSPAAIHQIRIGANWKHVGRSAV